MKSIQFKLTIVIFSILIVSLATLALLNYWKAKDLVLDGISQNLTSLATESGEQLSLWLDSRKSEILILANLPAVTTGNPEAIIPLLKATVQANKVFDTLSFADTTGKAYNSTGIITDLSDRDYLKQALRTGEVIISDPVYSKATGRLVTLLAVPVKSDGKIIGVLNAAVKMEELSRRVQSIKAGQTGYAYVVRHDGLVIIHPEEDKMLKLNLLSDSNVDQGLRALTASMVKGERGISLYRNEGVEK